MSATIIEQLIAPRIAKISDSFEVKRVLPYRAKRMIGPFCFLDHMGPHKLQKNDDADVLAHPHIGLSTVTYLFEGSLEHRDSTGAIQTIRPGDVNWMTAGKGVAHSERTIQSEITENSQLHGLQAWVALPKDLEECEPSFAHHPKKDLPVLNNSNFMLTLIVGKHDNLISPVLNFSNAYYAELKLNKNSTFVHIFAEDEIAFYLISGSIEIEGQLFSEPTLIIFKKNSTVRIHSHENSHGFFLGGQSMPEGRLIYWNFVASTQDLIDRAKTNWETQNFPKVPGETSFVPLPK